MLGMMNCPSDGVGAVEVFDFYCAPPPNESMKGDINYNFLSGPTVAIGNVSNALVSTGCSSLLPLDLGKMRNRSCSELHEYFDNKIKNCSTGSISPRHVSKEPTSAWYNLIHMNYAITKLERRSLSADTRAATGEKCKARKKMESLTDAKNEENAPTVENEETMTKKI